MKEPCEKDVRMVGGAFFVLLTAIGVWQLTKDRALAGWILVGLGALFLIGATLAPVILGPFYWLWMRFAFALGWFNARLLLTLFYAILLTPMALVGRLVRDGLDRRIDRDGESYWHERDGSGRDRERYEKQF